MTPERSASPNDHGGKVLRSHRAVGLSNFPGRFKGAVEVETGVSDQHAQFLQHLEYVEKAVRMSI